MSQAEQVLCVEERALSIFHGYGTPNGFEKMTDWTYGRLLELGNLRWFPRSFCETRPEYKQLIPYCLVVKGNTMLNYQRMEKVGESRLAGKWSVGIGGHVSMLDAFDVEEGKDIIVRAVRREVKEELNISEEWSASCVGCLYLNDSPVNKVHMGLVHVIRLSENAVVTNNAGKEHSEPLFLTEDKMLNYGKQYEGWSAVLLRHINDIL